MKKKRLVLAALVICLSFGMTGCGSAQKNTNVTAGMKAIESLNYAKAQTDFEKALVAGEEESLVYRGQGIAYLGAADYEKAINAFTKCLSTGNCMIGSMDYDVNFYLATAYDKAGKPAEAEKVYDAILALEPDKTQALYLRGQVRLEQGNAEKAKEDFDKVVKLEPQNYDMLINIYEALDQSGAKQQGQEYLKKALTDGDKTMTDYEKGRVNFFMGDYESARTFLKKAVDSGVAGSAYYLGKSWEATGDYNYAASVYTAYLQDHGEDALIDNQLALCQMKLGDYEKALTAIQNGLNLNDADMMQTLQFNQIVIYEHQGDFKQAAQLVNAYLGVYPDDAAAKREAEFLKTRS